MGRWTRRIWVCGLMLALAGCGDDDPAGRPSPSPTPTMASDTIDVVTPSEGGVITNFAVRIGFRLNGSFDPTSVELRVNDEIVDSQGGPEQFSATLNPGAPLRDDNSLQIQARTPAGTIVTTTRSFQYLPPKARARRITDAADLITGPLAQGRVGDFLLENTVARFVVQDAPKRELGNVGTYGGNLIDAELIGRSGRDNFLEIQPMVNVETVINAQHIEIVNDGQDGTAAIVRSCGPDDTLDFINPSSSIRDALGADLPPAVDEADYDVDGCTEYRLQTGLSYVEMVTTIYNHEDHDLGLFVGDFLAGGGQLDPWQSAKRRPSGIGEILASTVGVLSYIGFGEATGIDYGYIGLPSPGNTTPDDVLAVAGVEVVLHGQSIPSALFGTPASFVVPAGGSNSYRRLFSVGNGSGGNAIDILNSVGGVATGTIGGCVSSDGHPVAQTRIAVGPRSSAGELQGLTTHFVTGEDGCFEGTVVPGNYGVIAARDGWPFESNAGSPVVHPVTIVAGEATALNFDLPTPARVQVTVTDETGQPIPARATLVGLDPGPDPVVRTSFLTGTASTYLFQDRGEDGLPFGIVRIVYSGADGRALIEAKPGDYAVVVSRGSEYSSFEQRVTLHNGDNLAVAARIARVVDTTGFVSSDFHVHGLNSTDSRIGNRDRVLQYAGEGVENIVMTEHGGRTDLRPTISELQLAGFVHATIGEEITSWEYGHFNGYPFDLVPNVSNGGAVDWARAAPAGRDFIQYGAWSMTPGELDAAARSGPGARRGTIVQANHIHSYFGALQIDTSLVPPRSFISEAGKRAWRIDPANENLFHRFDALEVWNGSGRSHQERFINTDMGIWFNQLNQGLFSAGTGVIDSHGFFNLHSAGARTWTAAPSDSANSIDPDQVTDAVVAGRVVLGQGAYAQARLFAADGSANVADFTLGGSTLVRSTNGKVRLDVDVQAPLWAPFDRIEVYANSTTFPTGKEKGTNVSFSALPTVVHHAGEEFEVERLAVFPQIAGAERWQARDSFEFDELDRDTWFVVIVRGSDGVSRPMFPIMPADLKVAGNDSLDEMLDGNLDEKGVMAMAATNPLFADVDGQPGFQAPLAPQGN